MSQISYSSLNFLPFIIMYSSLFSRSTRFLSLCFALLCCVFTFSACGNMDERELQEQYSTAVVMVKNRAYYEIRIPNCPSFYFSHLDPEEGLSNFTTNVNEIEPTEGYGTGFFVGEDGKIVTNHHVVSGEEKKEEVTDVLKKRIAAILLQYINRYQELKSSLENCETYMQFTEEGTYEYAELENTHRNITDKIKELEDEAQGLLNIDVDHLRLIYHNEVGIVKNHASGVDKAAFAPCEILRTDKEHDLALLQLNTKKTPENCVFFDIPQEDPLVTYTFAESMAQKFGSDKNKELFMLSYNLGPNISMTKEGVKAQFNKGYVSQTSSEKILYSIPTLPGSSGSPVFNAKGELVAINYAGFSGTQGFNYGVPVRYLRQLMW